jgi:hypothetical protein
MKQESGCRGGKRHRFPHVHVLQRPYGVTGQIQRAKRDGADLKGKRENSSDAGIQRTGSEPWPQLHSRPGQISVEHRPARPDAIDTRPT